MGVRQRIACNGINDVCKGKREDKGTTIQIPSPSRENHINNQQLILISIKRASYKTSNTPQFSPSVKPKGRIMTRMNNFNRAFINNGLTNHETLSQGGLCATSKPKHVITDLTPQSTIFRNGSSIEFS